MPPRRSSPAQPAPSLLALPPEVLLHILAAVSQADRWVQGCERCWSDRRSEPANRCTQRPPLPLPRAAALPSWAALVTLLRRLSSVALTCKQLHGLCSAPPLLSSLDVHIRGARVLPRTQRLLRFLVTRGEHVRSLRLDVAYLEELPDYNQVAGLVTACVAACAARQGQPGSGLRRLVIQPHTPLAAGCLPLLSALEELHLPGRHSTFRLHLDDSWRQLTALRSAHLSGCLVCTGDGPVLPPSLTRLCIEGDPADFGTEPEPELAANVSVRAWQGCTCSCCGQYAGPLHGKVQHNGRWAEQRSALRDRPACSICSKSTELTTPCHPSPPLPPQVLAGLPALRCFELRNSAYPDDSLAAVSRLTTLTRLVVDCVDYPPPLHALAALAGNLRALEVRSGFGSHDLLDEALQALTGLERLALNLATWEDCPPWVPPSLALLPRLHRCSLSFYDVTGAPLQASCLPPLAALPFGSLRWLALPLELAVASHSTLAQAGQLHTLCLQLSEMDSPCNAGPWSAFWQLLATHPPLRCLLYEVAENASLGPPVFQLLDALLQLQRRRPSLEVRRLAGPNLCDGAIPACWAELHA